MRRDSPRGVDASIRASRSATSESLPSASARRHADSHSLRRSVRASARGVGRPRGRAGLGVQAGRRLGGRDLGADVAGKVVGERKVEQTLHRRARQPGALECRDRPGAVAEAQPQPAQALPPGGVGGRTLGAAASGFGGEIDRAHVLIDP